MKSRAFSLTVVACLLIVTPSEARERLKDGSTEAMMAEAVVRPLSLAGTVLGGAMYVITWPFAKLGKTDTAEAKRHLLDKPYEATFKRPLGDFKRLKEIREEQ